MPSSSALRTRVSTTVRVPVMRRNFRADVPPADWRSNLRPESRQRIVNKIVETLRRHFPIPVYEIFYFASAFEQRIYTIARNQTDYLRKISLKMLSVLQVKCICDTLREAFHLREELTSASVNN
ncbi:hypothetical protein J5N97_002873 [Dioscorea zingiberensis]|uniref:Mediator complex subunit 15 KIX domain-containing protein n=1 Tax=Dioscorea zingiberensis TaxID=325984 RepID=A0A9D5D4X2_9LILI|nr:hypothetical protein J5N97_002873 [Dioscorea zingiberensis]